MQNYELTLVSEPSKGFRATKAANSLDIDLDEKLSHHFKVEADVTSPFNIGLIVGASGSGKTTLAHQIYGDDCFTDLLDPELPVIEQFPERYSYDECAKMLSGVGLSAVVCWIRPAKTLSNGQKSRAEIALQLANVESDVVVIDEWTSVVDRTVAKVMSHSVQKFAQKNDAQIVLCSCHYDVIEWLNPDWIIDCNKQEFIDRRRLRPSFERSERLQFDIREVGRETWPYFSKYHYLSHKLPGGHIETFGLFLGGEQVGFQCFANYTPQRKGTKRIMHSNRTVIHPDYQGLSLGGLVIDESSAIMKGRGYKVMAKFSSVPVAKMMQRSPHWELRSVDRPHKISGGGNMDRKTGFRLDVKVYSFEYIGPAEPGRS